MINKLEAILVRYEKLNSLISQQNVLSDMETYRKYTKELADMEETVNAYLNYKKLVKQKEDAENSLNGETDSEMKALLGEEIKSLKALLVAVLTS